ncbi:MAG: hypothetical protein IPK88_03695 [Saprospiraceae bacterium]|nr:hypothetical protein [Candidatus Defluviibacterium haderslevense]MBL0236121.1 hypothetical protein [Candidatus Defluviibacterium haderslevense]
MKKLILSAMLLVALTFGMTSCNNTEKKTMTEQGKHNHIDGDNHETVYKCPMDCEKGKTYEKKGTCPVCKMELVEKEHSDHKEGDGHDHKNGDGHDHKEGDGHKH